MSKLVSTPPDASGFIESQRCYGYSFESALADIIDNSIFAESQNIHINFYPKDDSLSIIDDGSGMSENELYNAMIFGSGDPSKPRDPKDLGRFGMGMKSASISQCTRLIVLSRKAKKLSGAIWDIDRIKKTGRWDLEQLNQKDIQSLVNDHLITMPAKGTAVIWDNIDSMQGNAQERPDEKNRKITIAMNHLRLTFHRFMEKKSLPLKIVFNGSQLIPLNPFLEGKSQETPAQQIEIGGTGKYILMQGFTLPSLNRMSPEEEKELELDRGFAATQGFYIYRNKRLITTGGWFGLERLQATTNLSRVSVEVPNFLDKEWDTDVKKTGMTPPPTILFAMRKLLAQFHNPSKKIYKRHGKKAIEKSKLWLRSINYDAIDDVHIAQYDIDKNAELYRFLADSITEDQLEKLTNLIFAITREIPFASIFADYNDRNVK